LTSRSRGQAERRDSMVEASSYRNLELIVLRIAYLGQAHVYSRLLRCACEAVLGICGNEAAEFSCFVQCECDDGVVLSACAGGW
jgi:hypothetical protein